MSGLGIKFSWSSFIEDNPEFIPAVTELKHLYELGYLDDEDEEEYSI